MTTEPINVEEGLKLLARATERGRRLPWKVWTSCSYRRIKTDYAPGDRDGEGKSVLEAYRCSDGGLDLSMPEDQLIALVDLINMLPALLASQQQLAEAVEVVQRLCECVDPVLPPEGYYETVKVPIPEDQFGNTEATTISTIISVKTRTKDIRALRAATNNARNFLATLDDNAPEQERE